MTNVEKAFAYKGMKLEITAFAVKLYAKMFGANVVIEFKTLFEAELWFKGYFNYDVIDAAELYDGD